MRTWAILFLLPAGTALAADLPTFKDVTAESGIDFRHSYGDEELDNIVEGTGAGACMLDYDDDGFQDLYFVSGAWTRGVSSNRSRDLRAKLQNRLYRNAGDGTFTDVTEASGAGDPTFSTGCSAADYDNDGDVDLYVLNYADNVLYRNNGDGTFTDVTVEAGLAVPRWSLHAVWLDYDNDGWLDVYVANYLLYDDGMFRDFYAAQGYPGPLSYASEPDVLFHNNGDGTFTDVTAETGVASEDGRAMSVGAADFRNQGRVGIYVTNDATENNYFEPTDDGTFEDAAVKWNLAYGENGQNVASMGPAIGDIDRNGYLDVFIPDLNYCTLLMQYEHGFDHKTSTAGLSVVMGQYTSWGPVLFDYDNDGWLDLFTTHGNAHHEYVEEDTLVRNKGNGDFEDVSAVSGQFFHEKYVGRGATYGDYDNDGDLDLLVVNLNDRPNLLRNDGGNRRHWLKVVPRLRFPSGERDALGARVRVASGGITQIEDMIPVRGYLGQADSRLHFGLGESAVADVEIRWPDGTVERRDGVAAGQVLTIVREDSTME
ncbi:MAG: CRTAC1 family protein [Sedimentisphaerales bacterium]|nr:CRTAC1 family protein [Sedimentisphaerales bacterium]